MSVVQLRVRLDPDVEGQPALVDAGRRRRGDDGLALEGLALVGQMELAVLDPRCVGAQLLERVLDLEQVGEVAGGVDPDLQVDGLVLMVEDRQLLVEAIAHRPLADDRQLGVDVDRPGPGHEEEARLEVLEVVDRQRVEPLAVDRQHPARQEPRVEREESRRLGGRCLDVAALVADDERVAVEDPDDLASHRQPLRLPMVRADDVIFRRVGAGKSRWKRTSSAGSPSRRIWPRSVAAMALARPLARSSNTAASVRMTQSAGPASTRHGHGPSTNVHPPMFGAAVALEVQAQAGGRAAEQRLRLASAEPLEESCRRVSHRHPWRGRSTDVVGVDVTESTVVRRHGGPHHLDRVSHRMRAGRARYTLRRASGGMADAPALGAGAA